MARGVASWRCKKFPRKSPRNKVCESEISLEKNAIGRQEKKVLAKVQGGNGPGEGVGGGISAGADGGGNCDCGDLSLLTHAC